MLDQVQHDVILLACPLTTRRPQGTIVRSEETVLAELKIIPWQPLIRPPAPGSNVPDVPAGPLKALACRNSVVSLAFLVTTDRPVHARVEFTDLKCNRASIPVNALFVRLVGAVPAPETGAMMDVLSEFEAFSIIGSAALHITATVPKGIPAGTYTGRVILTVNGEQAASNDIEIEVGDVDLPDVDDWSFFLNVWANPATIARWHGVEVWSEQHFVLMRPYIDDLAAHGQKTAVVPICYQPWGTQTRDPFPSAVVWKRRGGNYEFDFSILERYVDMHVAAGIDRAIHCYTVAQAVSGVQGSVIEYIDVDSGETKRIQTEIGDAEWTRAWQAFFDAFRRFLTAKGWLARTYIAFDERSEDVMTRVMAMLSEHAPDFKTALAANTRSDAFERIDDLCLSGSFDEKGIAELAPAERSAMGVAELLEPKKALLGEPLPPPDSEAPITTFYVCCGPEWPNTFLFSPLVESRMLPWLAAQGSYDGFLRWSYNDWPDDPYVHPEWAPFPTGDCYFVYPGRTGPVSSLRWEQLREGIQDYELALIAASRMRTSEDMVDYEQAISLACRNPNGRDKAVGDIELARRLLMPIAAR